MEQTRRNKWHAHLSGMKTGASKLHIYKTIQTQPETTLIHMATSERPIYTSVFESAWPKIGWLETTFLEQVCKVRGTMPMTQGMHTNHSVAWPHTLPQWRRWSGTMNTVVGICKSRSGVNNQETDIISCPCPFVIPSFFVDFVVGVVIFFIERRCRNGTIGAVI